MTKKPIEDKIQDMTNSLNMTSNNILNWALNHQEMRREGKTVWKRQKGRIITYSIFISLLLFAKYGDYPLLLRSTATFFFIYNISQLKALYTFLKEKYKKWKR